MKVNRKGTTRVVFVFKDVVVKVPNFFNGWLNFIKGIVANIDENQTWKWNSGKYEGGNSHLLCPVQWCSWGGWILIMKRAIPCQWEEEIDYTIWEKAGLSGDDKQPNFGWYKGKIVKIDYGS